PDLVGRTIEDFERQQDHLGHRIYLTRVRREGKILPHDQQLKLKHDDTLAVSALRGALVDFDARTHIGPEADDADLLHYDTESLHVVVSEKEQIGKTIADLREERFMIGVYIDEMYRSGAPYPYRLATKLSRG
ncbi:aspartate-alanine antiporter, partial [Streptomyces sp. SID11233]|nr:aspartate-alanine antiporter [Streptomyces sp. SID11233]